MMYVCYVQKSSPEIENEKIKNEHRVVIYWMYKMDFFFKLTSDSYLQDVLLRTIS